jgi:FixJ family two-component response regulator
VAANWDIPIIFMTSHVDEEVRAQALDAGAIDFLYKPFPEAELLNAIDQALQRS